MKNYLYIILFFLITSICYGDTIAERIYGSLTVDTDLEVTDVLEVKSSGVTVINNPLTVSASNFTVDTNLLKVDSALNKVGILKTVPTVELDIVGDTTMTGTATADTLILTNGAERITGTTYGEYIDFNDLGDGFITMDESVVISSGLTVNNIFKATASQVSVINNDFVTTGGYLHFGSGATFQPFYQEEGDIYTEVGKMYAGGGINAVAERYGVGYQLREFSLTKTLLYNIDATFTASTATIEKAGETFLSDGVEAGDFMVVTSTTEAVGGQDFTGSTGEILDVTETTIIVSLAAAGTDVIIDLTGFDFVVYNHPIVAFLDNGDIHFNVGSSPNARFHIESETGTNIHSIDANIFAGVDGHAGFNMDIDADTKSNVAGFEVKFNASGFDEAGDLGIGYEMLVNNTGTSGDIHGLEVSLTDASTVTVEVEALATRRGVDVIGQYLTVAADLEAAYVYDASLTTYTNRLTEFSSSINNIEIFVEDNDQILLASMSQWDDIANVLSVNSSQTIIPVFEYIDDDGNWTIFSLNDATDGYKSSGDLIFNKANLTDWGQRTVNEVTGEAGAVDYYWIRIRRTRAIISPNVPTESTISIRTRGSKYKWDKHGEVFASTLTVEKISEIACGAAYVGKIYYDSDDNTFYGCNNAGWQAFH